MTGREKLSGLKPLAELIRDRDLATFAQLNRQRQTVLAKLAALGDAPPAAPAEDLSEVLFAKVAEDHGLWRAQRRRELNSELAKLSANWIEARHQAARAFGRSTMISRALPGARKF